MLFERRERRKAKRAIGNAVSMYLGEWQADRAQLRYLRAYYAAAWLLIAFVQLVVMDVAFWRIGLHELEFHEEWTVRIFLGGTLTDVLGIVLIITRYLFHEKTIADSIPQVRDLAAMPDDSSASDGEPLFSLPPE